MTVGPGTRSVAGEPSGMYAKSAPDQKTAPQLSGLTSFPPDVSDLTRVSFCKGFPLTNRSRESRGEIPRLAASEVDSVAVG